VKDTNVIELARPAAGPDNAVPPVLSTGELLLLRNASALLEERAGPESGVDSLREAGLNAVTLIETLRPDAETLATSMLLPAYEAGIVDEPTVSARVDPAVSRMLQGAERIAALKELRHAEVRPLQIDRLRQMLLTMAEDPRVVLVRLADQLCTMRSAKTASDEVRRRLGEETLEVFAPLANRLGVGQLKWELEDLAFRFVDPAAYCAIADQVNERRIEREQYIKRVLTQLVAELKRAGITCEVSGRPKHIYSIYRKTQRKGVGVEQVFDQIGLRILVDEVADCYAALGLVHSLWAPVPSEFDDYIARPKANNYQSLHTAVIGPDTRTMEVQIRTYAMHRHAELGVAAHWQYKEKSPDWSGWSRRVLERNDPARDEDDGSDLIARYRDIAFNDRIYVITPQGRIIDLPAGATALDFAYAVHTDLGHQCRGAKSGGVILPLTQPLTSGATVEILTGREGGPSRDWLNPQLGYLKSGTARAKVRRWFRDRDRAEHITQGRAILERELRRLGIADANFGDLAQALSLDSADDLLAALGRGDVSSAQIAQALQPPRVETPALPLPTTTEKPGSKGDVIVLGVSDVMTRTARCCNPVPGEAIGGYITVGQGVSIHRADCVNLEKLRQERPERIMEVSWGDQITSAHRAIVDIEAIDRRGLLRDVSDVFSNEKIDILAVNTQSNESTSTAHMQFTVLVSDRRQLEQLMRRLDRLPDVRTVRRRS
jgi:GTP pyrophosphokinase